MSENQEFHYKVQGSAADPYRVRFTAKDGLLHTSCSCPSGRQPGRRGRLCKHREQLLSGDYRNVVGHYVRLPDAFARLGATWTHLGAPGLARAGLASLPETRCEPARPIRTSLGLCVDVETSGPTSGRDAIIEVAAILFRFDPDRGEMLGPVATYASLQDTLARIHRGATRTHGLTRQDIAGHQADWGLVQRMIDRADLVLAHNADFDFGFLAAQPQLTVDAKPWACTFRQIDWRRHGFASSGLEALAKAHGIPHAAHRALGDTQALVDLLGRETPAGGTYLGELLRSLSNGKRRH